MKRAGGRRQKARDGARVVAWPLVGVVKREASWINGRGAEEKEGQGRGVIGDGGSRPYRDVGRRYRRLGEKGPEMENCQRSDLSRLSGKNLIALFMKEQPV